MSDWFCTKCGEIAPLKPGYLVFDPRYAIVEHHGHDYPAVSDDRIASAIRSRVAAESAKGQGSRR